MRHFVIHLPIILYCFFFKYFLGLGFLVCHNRPPVSLKLFGPVGVAAVVLIPNSFFFQVFCPLGCFYKKTPTSEIPKNAIRDSPSFLSVCFVHFKFLFKVSCSTQGWCLITASNNGPSFFMSDFIFFSTRFDHSTPLLFHRCWPH